MISSECWRPTGRLVAVAALIAAHVMAASNTSFAQDVLASGQTVSGGGRSVAADRVIVGTIVYGPSGTSSDGLHRIDGGAIYYPQPMMATYAGNPVEVVDAENRTLKIAVQGGSGPLTGRLFHRLGGQASYVQDSMTLGLGDTLVYVLPATRLALRGLEYYFELNRRPATIQVGSQTQPLIFITRLNNLAGPALPAGQYRMIGFPFKISPSSPAQVFEDDLGKYVPTAWRLGRYDPRSDDYNEYPDVGNIVSGRGYWLIVHDSRSVGASGESAIPDTTVGDGESGLRYGRIMLEPGWNQIATPFGFPVAWGDRRAESGVEPVIWAYTSGFDSVTSYVTTETLVPFEGYWLYNASPSRRQLLLPYTESVRQHAERKAARQDSSEWRINLSVTAGSVGDRGDVAGIAVGSEPGWDDRDFTEPPVDR